MAITIRVLGDGKVAMAASKSYVTDAGGGDFTAYEHANLEVGRPAGADFESQQIVDPKEVPKIVRGMLKNGQVHRPQGGVAPSTEAGLALGGTASPENIAADFDDDAPTGGNVAAEVEW